MTTPSVPDRFEVLAEVASTDTEILLRARDTVLDREVFLKCPGPGLATAYRDRDLAETVMREARALARVRHPAVIGLIDVHETPDGPLLVLDPVTGETLTERLAREKHLEPAEVVELGIGLAGALEAVHAAGIVHRGITADCVVLGSAGRASLTGFHFAKAHAGSGLVSMASLEYESEAKCPALPEHPAPEQYKGQKADARCDLFSLAWVLFESLTGEAPFDGTNAFEWKSPKDAGTLVDGAPRGLVRALAACLAPDASRRLEDAGALRRALEACRVTSQDTEVPTPENKSRRTAGWVTATAIVVLAGLAFTQRGRFGASAADTGRGIDFVEAAPATGSVPGEAYGSTFRSSRALLIGIGSAYAGNGFASLRNTVRDVDAVEERLLELGWRVDCLRDGEADRKGIVDGLKALRDESEAEDQVLVWFAGHGMGVETTDNTGWIVPANSKVDDESSRIRFSEIEDFLIEVPAKHVLVAVDCCHSGRMSGLGASRGAENYYRANYVTRRARVCLVSARPDEAAADGRAGGNSPFAAAFLNALSTKSEAITSSEVGARIQREFAERGHVQVPDRLGEGEFVFFLED